MPTAISSEHASLVHLPDVRVPFRIVLTVLEGKILVRHVMQYIPVSKINECLLLGTDAMVVFHLASSVCLGSVFL